MTLPAPVCQAHVPRPTCLQPAPDRPLRASRVSGREHRARTHVPQKKAGRQLEPLARRDRLPTDGTGRRQQKTSTFDTKRDAQAWLAKITQELRAGEVYDTTLTVGGFLTGWLEGRQSLSPSTRQAHQAHLGPTCSPS